MREFLATPEIYAIEAFKERGLALAVKLAASTAQPAADANPAFPTRNPSALYPHPKPEPFFLSFPTPNRRL